jgi:6-phosphogluconate dehydrogenase
MRNSVAIVSDAIKGVKLEILAEAYSILKSSIRLSLDEMRTVFSEWNRGGLADPLVDAAADALGLRDEDGDPLLEKVLDVPRGSSLCGPAAALALELGVPAPIATQAAHSFFIAGMKDERVDASAVLSGPKTALSGERHSMIEELRKALEAAFILAYVEAYSLSSASGADEEASRAALAEEGSSLAAAATAAAARRGSGRGKTILLDVEIKPRLDYALPSLRRVCARSAEAGLYLPCLSAAVSYYDGMRSTWLPANLVVALRDSREGTLYERVDRPRGEVFHSDWK